MAQKIDKSFVSELDQFLDNVRNNVPEKDSQRRERKKYEKINHLRDNPQEKSDSSKIWEDF